MSHPSKPSLRSSSRQGLGLGDSPATDNPSPGTRPGKRPYNLLAANESEQAIKKQKLNNIQRLARPHIIPRNHVKKTSNTAPKLSPSGVARLEVDTSARTANAVQPLANGTIITNGEPSPTRTETTKGKRSKEIDKRTLRSQDGGSRSKSELSLYFPNYDELISNEPKEPEFLTPETRIFIVDETPKSSPSNPTFTTPAHNALKPISLKTAPMINGSSQTTIPLNHDIIDLNDAQKVDFTSIEQHAQYMTVDPLTADIYFKAHRRAERQEKQLRNIEKERAQHEKVQLERLLDGLKGHDWLRVMGISGITDSDKKSFEPKRDWFVREVGSLIEKFRVWKEEEKRRKVEKEQSLAADEDDEERVEEDEEEDTAASHNTGAPPDLNDVDAWAARQLHQEAISASASTSTTTRSTKLTRLSSQHSTTPRLHLFVGPPPLEKPFTSFYSKPYLREAAVSKHRRGRTRFAFGQPVPEVGERMFKLPGSILTEDAIRSAARRGRMQRRGRAET